MLIKNGILKNNNNKLIIDNIENVNVSDKVYTTNDIYIGTIDKITDEIILKYDIDLTKINYIYVVNND